MRVSSHEALGHEHQEGSALDKVCKTQVPTLTVKITVTPIHGAAVIATRVVVMHA